MVADDFRLRKLYGQILLGFSPAKIGGVPVYIRHFCPSEQGELDAEYSGYLENAISRDLESDEIKLAQLKTNGLWVDTDESFIENQQRYLQGLRDTKKNLALPSQVDQQNILIEEAEKALRTKLMARAELMGLTAEGFARKKLNELYIFKSLFSDNACARPLFTDEDFEYLDMGELNNIAGIFNEAVKDLNDNTIKNISIRPFFQNSFSLCDDNIFNFFGKPIVALTFHQSELAGYARYFKSILHSEPKPPADVLADPDKMIDWHQTSKNTDKMLRANQSGNVAVFDATPKDMAALSENHGEVASFEKMAQGKTKMRGAEFMKLLG